MTERSRIEYNGHAYTWAEFKTYWLYKLPMGWKFDDLDPTQEAVKLKF
jgi:hypothetical protein